MILHIITEVVDFHCPNKIMKFRDYSLEWITKELIEELSHKDHLYINAKRSGCPDDWTDFQKKKIETKKLLQNAQEEFLKGKLENLKDNPRKFWRVVNEMSGIGKNKKNKNGCGKIEEENGTIHENMEAAEFMNNYYVNVGPSLANDHKIIWDKPRCKVESNLTFTFSVINAKEVQELVKDIQIIKSSAIEGLSSRLLKDSFEVIISELTHLYNCSLQQGKFPELWGISRVTHIHPLLLPLLMGPLKARY